MANPNLAIVTTDWHVTSNGESGGVGETQANDALAVARHINFLQPSVILDLGDCKDHYGSDTGDELDLYKSNVYNVLSPAPYVLPGNHDEINDYDVAGTDLSLWTARFWDTPFHWTVDWAAPKIRFIGIHTRIVHDSPDVLNGYGEIDASETSWLTTVLAGLPVGYKAIVCSHFPLASALGNEVHDSKGGSALRTLLAANSATIAACFCGHRHLIGTSTTLNSIVHICVGSMAYTQANALGAFMLMEFDGANTITCHLRYGPSGLLGGVGVAAYTPLTISV